MTVAVAGNLVEANVRKFLLQHFPILVKIPKVDNMLRPYSLDAMAHKMQPGMRI